MDESIQQKLISLWRSAVRGDVVGRDKIATEFRDMVIHIHEAAKTPAEQVALHETLTYEMIQTLSAEAAGAQMRIGELEEKLAAAERDRKRLKRVIRDLQTTIHNATQDEDLT